MQFTTLANVNTYKKKKKGASDVKIRLASNILVKIPLNRFSLYCHKDHIIATFWIRTRYLFLFDHKCVIFFAKINIVSPPAIVYFT